MKEILFAIVIMICIWTNANAGGVHHAPYIGVGLAYYDQVTTKATYNLFNYEIDYNVTLPAESFAGILTTGYKWDGDGWAVLADINWEGSQEAYIRRASIQFLYELW